MSRTLFLALCFICTAAGQAAAAGCPVAARPSVNIRVEERAGYGGPAQIPPDQAGVTRGTIAVDHRIGFRHASSRSAGTGCVWIATLDVTIRLDPRVRISDALFPHACLYRKVFAHEVEHVNRDRRLVEAYADRIMDGLAMAYATPADYTSRLVPVSSMESVRRSMEKEFVDVLGVLFDRLVRERQETQRFVDSPQGRALVRESC